MKKQIFTLLFATTMLAAPAFAQQATQLSPLDMSGKVVDVHEDKVVNPDGTVTITRKVTTETENPNTIRPAGVPADAKARNRTTTVTTITHPAGGPSISYDGINEPVNLDPNAPGVLQGHTVSRTIKENHTLRIKNPDGTEKVIVNGVEQKIGN